jgi:flagellar FliL protein
MADETTPAPAAGGAAAAPKAPSKLLLPIVVAAATLAGGAVGVMVVAPMFIASRAAQASEGLDPEGAGAADDGHGAPVGGGPMFKVDNLIVNPAGSQGSRFLMVSVAVETPDPKIEEHLRKQEPRIRDLIIGLLEQQTMEMLSRPGVREEIKLQLGDSISMLAGVKVRAFLPQFVIQ